MNYIIKSAKTVDEAVSEALKELNIKREEAKIEILEEAQKGFLGIIGGKDATVKVSKITETKDILNEIFNDNFEVEKSQNDLEDSKDKFENKEYTNEELDEDVENIDIDLVEITKNFLEKVLKSLDVEGDIDIKLEDNVLLANIDASDDKLGIIIGKRGQTLDSIQYILSLIVNKNSNKYIKTTLDCSGYREKRINTLEELAKKMANKVIETNRSIKLEPMNAYERKIIHTTLQEFEGVITHSEGKDPFRKVVIKKERKY